jgi:purine nucleoside permease
MVAEHAVRVLVLTMFDSPPDQGIGEAFRWIERCGLEPGPRLPGLCPDYPLLWGSEQGVWLVTTGMGEANAAASLAAVLYGAVLDLRQAYVLVAGIAGIAPEAGTLGSVVWADYAVHGGYAHELDAREIPAGWPHGFVALGADAPGRPPALRIAGDVFTLNPGLVRAAHALTREAELDHGGPEVQRVRDSYPGARRPDVLIGSTLTQSVFWSGAALSARARQWVEQFTGARGRYCTTQMEDNATLTVLDRAAAAGLVDFGRVAVLRAGANFDQPPPGAAPYSAFLETAGWRVAAENAWRAGNLFASHVVERWRWWSAGIPDGVLEVSPA